MRLNGFQDVTAQMLLRSENWGEQIYKKIQFGSQFRFEYEMLLIIFRLSRSASATHRE